MAKVDIEDLSGLFTPVTDNPYDRLINACEDNAKLLQGRYQLHRVTRNSLQKDKILADDFSGWVLDEHLIKLDGISRDPGYVDPRNCLVFWARPPEKVRNLIDIVQQKLKNVAPDLWLMPLKNLHLTAMEVTHSLTAEQIDKIVADLELAAPVVADYPFDHRARLIKPMLSYDSAALALSFVPASGELLTSGRTEQEDAYTYHHLRRDLHAAITKAGVLVGSRYVVPSAHLTIARFNSANVFGGDPLDGHIGQDLKYRKNLVNEIELINKWLESEFWPDNESSPDHIRPGGEWIVGQEKGLDFRKGRLWYGGGESLYVGKGF